MFTGDFCWKNIYWVRWLCLFTDAARVKVKTQCDCSIIFVSKIWTLTVESELNRVHATGQMPLTIQISLGREQKKTDSSCNISGKILYIQI